MISVEALWGAPQTRAGALRRVPPRPSTRAPQRRKTGQASCRCSHCRGQHRGFHTGHKRGRPGSSSSAAARCQQLARLNPAAQLCRQRLDRIGAA
eukprot:2872699-Prymnesium_polylepis.4